MVSCSWAGSGPGSGPDCRVGDGGSVPRSGLEDDRRPSGSSATRHRTRSKQSQAHWRDAATISLEREPGDCRSAAVRRVRRPRPPILTAQTYPAPESARHEQPGPAVVDELCPTRADVVIGALTCRLVLVDAVECRAVFSGICTGFVPPARSNPAQTEPDPGQCGPDLWRRCAVTNRRTRTSSSERDWN
jgi:hypothetical protein